MYYYICYFYDSGQTSGHNKMAAHCRRFFFPSNIYFKSDAFNIMVRVVICLTNWYFNTLFELDVKNNNNIKVRRHNIKIYISLASFFF
jgi:hypothetical protein